MTIFKIKFSESYFNPLKLGETYISLTKTAPTQTASPYSNCISFSGVYRDAVLVRVGKKASDQFLITIPDNTPIDLSAKGNSIYSSFL